MTEAEDLKSEIDRRESDWQNALPWIRANRDDLTAQSERSLEPGEISFERKAIERQALLELFAMNPTDVRKMWTDYKTENYPQDQFEMIEAKIHLYKVIVERYHESL